MNVKLLFCLATSSKTLIFNVHRLIYKSCLVTGCHKTGRLFHACSNTLLGLVDLLLAVAKPPSIDKLPESGLTLKAADTCTKSTLQELGAIVSRALSVDCRLGAQDVPIHDRPILPETVVLLTSTVDGGTPWVLAPCSQPPVAEVEYRSYDTEH